MAASRLEVVSSEDLSPAPAPAAPAVAPPSRETVVAVEAKEILGLMLRVLSQRVVLFGNALMPVIALALGFVLILHILDNPTTLQIVAVGVYGIFALSLILMRAKP